MSSISKRLLVIAVPFLMLFAACGSIGNDDGKADSSVPVDQIADQPATLDDVALSGDNCEEALPEGQFYARIPGVLPGGSGPAFPSDDVAKTKACWKARYGSADVTQTAFYAGVTPEKALFETNVSGTDLNAWATTFAANPEALEQVQSNLDKLFGSASVEWVTAQKTEPGTYCALGMTPSADQPLPQIIEDCDLVFPDEGLDLYKVVFQKFGDAPLESGDIAARFFEPNRAVWLIPSGLNVAATNGEVDMTKPKEELVPPQPVAEDQGTGETPEAQPAPSGAAEPTPPMPMCPDGKSDPATGCTNGQAPVCSSGQDMAQPVPATGCRPDEPSPTGPGAPAPGAPTDTTPGAPAVPNPTGPPNGPAGPGCGEPGQDPCPGGGEGPVCPVGSDKAGQPIGDQPDRNHDGQVDARDCNIPEPTPSPTTTTVKTPSPTTTVSTPTPTTTPSATTTTPPTAPPTTQPPTTTTVPPTTTPSTTAPPTTQPPTTTTQSPPVKVCDLADGKVKMVSKTVQEANPNSYLLVYFPQNAPLGADCKEPGGGNF